MALEDRLLGKTEPRRNATSSSDEQRTPLWNTHLARLAKAFAQVSVRSEQATMLEIIWSLSVADKLPFPQPWFTSMSATIMKGCRSGKVEYFNEATAEALYLINTYANGTRGIHERGVAWLLDLFHSIKDASERVGQGHGLDPDQLQVWLRYLRGRIESTAAQLGPDFLGRLTELYTRQGREMDFKFCKTPRERLPAHLTTPLHRRAMLRGMIGRIVPPEQRAFVNVL
ncbi:hypothetical protein NCS56_00214800 [Fusarium sp. Ph1]|nr:hypothetical protein NCS56_00214800 [Fusarium sp. Ph1]